MVRNIEGQNSTSNWLSDDIWVNMINDSGCFGSDSSCFIYEINTAIRMQFRIAFIEPYLKKFTLKSLQLIYSYL